MIKDPLGLKVFRAQLHLQLGQAGEAEALYGQLLSLNPDNYDMHAGLLQSKGLFMSGTPEEQQQGLAAGSGGGAPFSGFGGRMGIQSSGVASLRFDGIADAQRTALTALYTELAAEHPRSSACARIPLDFLQGEAFLTAADKYVRRFLEVGIPSLFSELKPLYRCVRQVSRPC